MFGTIRESLIYFFFFPFRSVWLTDHSYFSLPQKEPPVAYPRGFQEDYIPVHGPTVAKLIEDRVDGQDLLDREDGA